MHLSLLPLLALLATGTSISAAPWREHQHRCDAANTTVTVTATRTITVLLTSQAVSASVGISASASAKSSAPALSSSKAVSAASAAKSSASSIKPSASVASSKAAGTSASVSAFKTPTSTSTSVAHTSSTTSKAPVSSSTSKAASSTFTAAVTASTGTTSTDADAQTYLNLHNNFREHYEASAVTWNHTLSVYAQNAANKCVFQHTNGPYGENLAAGVGGGYSITSGFNGWADEASDYDASNPQYSHFTQVVWKGTTQIGCASASCADGTIFTGYNQNALNIVCEYYPRGNYIGEFAQNVGTYQA